MVRELVNVFHRISNINEVLAAGAVVLEGCYRSYAACRLAQSIHLSSVGMPPPSNYDILTFCYDSLKIIENLRERVTTAGLSDV